MEFPSPPADAALPGSPSSSPGSSPGGTKLAVLQHSPSHCGPSSSNESQNNAAGRSPNSNIIISTCSSLIHALPIESVPAGSVQPNLRDMTVGKIHCHRYGVSGRNILEESESKRQTVPPEKYTPAAFGRRIQKKCNS